MPKRNQKKHPKDMTDEEALKHLFHPKIVKAVKKHLESQNAHKEQPQKPKQQ